MRHRFSTSVSMECTIEQFKQDLESGLSTLGYRTCYSSHKVDLIVTRDAGSHNRVFMYEQERSPSSKNKEGRYYIDHYNPELFLALAAMTEDEEWIVGEWLVHIGYSGNYSDIFKVKELIGANWENGMALPCDSNRRIYRKATKEEIINHLTKDMKKEVALPEKWYVEVTGENRETINKWKSKQQYNGDLKTNLYEFVCYNGAGFYKSNEATQYNDYQKITFEQFKKYILGEDEVDKELIGYKLVKPEYEEVVFIIGDKNRSSNTHTYFDNNTLSINANMSIKLLKEAGVLDLWFEPVYKDIKPKLPEIKGHDYGLSSTGVRFKKDNTELSNEFMNRLDSLTSALPQCNRSIAKVTLTSGIVLTSDQIKQIAKVINYRE